MSRLEELTPRQRQVLQLVVQGHCNKEVAATQCTHMFTMCEPSVHP